MKHEDLDLFLLDDGGWLFTTLGGLLLCGFLRAGVCHDVMIWGCLQTGGSAVFNTSLEDDRDNGIYRSVVDLGKLAGIVRRSDSVGDRGPLSSR